jgi:replication initiation and membrane attachment protein
MKEIERLSTLYGVDVINTASLVSNVYEPTNPKGTRVDMKKLSTLLQNEVNYRFLSHKKVVNKSTGISSDTDLAQKITLMEKSSPKDFLMALQNGTQAAGADLRLIEDLAMKFKLTNGVINVLVEYTLSTNNNVLSRAYIEKVAASLVREGITTALDAMNYLRDINKKAKQSKQNKTVKTRNTIIKAEVADLDIEPVKDTTDEAFDWEALVKEIDG